MSSRCCSNWGSCVSQTLFLVGILPLFTLFRGKPFLMPFYTCVLDGCMRTCQEPGCMGRMLVRAAQTLCQGIAEGSCLSTADSLNRCSDPSHSPCRQGMTSAGKGPCARLFLGGGKPETRIPVGKSQPEPASPHPFCERLKREIQGR